MKIVNPLSEKDLRHLENVIHEVEQKTSGEIRLIIVRRSIVFSTLLFMTLWGWISSLAFVVVWFERHQFIWLADWWLVPAILVFAGLIAWAISRQAYFIRMFCPAQDMRRAVLLRAELEFHREGLAKTSGQTGILLFLSLLEHQAVVLADQAIAARLPDSTWEDVVRTMLKGANGQHWVESLEEALRQCGEKLREHFPIQADDHNELANHVVVKD